MGKFPTSLIVFYLLQTSLVFGMIHHLPSLKHLQEPKSQIFWIMTFISFIFSLLVYIKNPGHLAEQFVKQVNLNHPEAAPQSPQQNPLETGKNIIDNIPSQNFQKRYCRLCNVSQPFRAKHCHDCGKCVSTFDHHCFLLSNCIGEKNRHYFYIFLSVESVRLSYAIFIAATKIQFVHPDMIHLATLGGLCIALAMTILMFVFHTYLMLRGITTWEYFSWKYISYLNGFERYRSPFSKGICSNITTYWSSGCRSSNTEWIHEYYPQYK